ncbi:MAG: TerB family tellurite resistance protein [Chitinophagaceae bacterium]|nr:MAG: TerB family tellurite resistance protein [Chitinophagaceae bacterium]
MKRSLFVLGLIIVFCLQSGRSVAQIQELQQLALNIEKLAQFRQILADLKKGYEIVTTGYNTIKNLSQGNFELHKVFLDGLTEVNPAIRNYKRVGDIVSYQVLLVKEYKTAFQHCKASGLFNSDEIEYMGRVYGRLFDASLKNLDDLFTVITANKLRMSDQERLSAINKIFLDMEDKLTFLRHFNNSNAVLSLQRAKEQKEVDNMRQLEGIK